jgi:general secretion pathway protein B
MSLILDALKKSEAERQRQSGPTLLEVRISKPRRRYPTWVIAVGALLAVNIVLLLAFALHRPATPAAGSPPSAATGTAASGAGASGNASSGNTSAGTAPAAAMGQNPAPLAAPPVAPMATEAPLAPGSLVPAAPGVGAPASAGVDVDTMEPESRIPSPAGASGDAQERTHNPADDQPALPPGSQDRNIPNFSEVSGDLPDLRLDLHVYAEHVRDRYAMINMHRVHEGDTLPEGPQVLAITRGGVVLQYRGQEFTLRPQ